VARSRVTAKVNYRHLRQSYLNNIFGKGDHPAYPLVEIASRTRMLKIGENKPEPARPTDNQDWMRWNNLGIALLDQFQYMESVQAFTKWSSCAPTTPTATPTSASLRLCGRSTTRRAGPFNKALALDPNSARAHSTTMACCNGAPAIPRKEIADFRKVVEMFPQSRDARRELGITYYQQNDEHNALEQFEALQKIDPDDLVAHYNLSILYRRMGKKEEAAETAGHVCR
jgi:Tfp pilus assembly protein PilF